MKTLLNEGNVAVKCVDLSSDVENEMGMESPAMASCDQFPSTVSGQSDVMAPGNAMIQQICQAGSQNSGQTDSSLKAHDYIGLCEVSSRAVRAEASAMDEQQQHMVMGVVLQETELRLGRTVKPGPAYCQSFVRPCGNVGNEISVKELIREVGDGVEKSFGKSESFKRRCVEEKVWDLDIGLSSKSVAHPEEEVGENKLSSKNERILKVSLLDSKERALVALEDEQELLPAKSGGKQQLDKESSKQKQQLLEISVRGEAECGALGLNTLPHVSQERGSSHPHKFSAVLSFWQPPMMTTAPEAAHCLKINEPQSAHYYEDLETSSASFKGALDCMKTMPTIPKHGVAGAKRIFSEAIGNQDLKHQVPSAIFPWASPQQRLASWSLGLKCPDGAAAPFGPFLSPGRNLIKVDASILHCLEAFSDKSLGQGCPPEIGHGMQNGQTTSEDNSTATPPRDVVGWPPVQSFRKNSFRPPKPKKLVTSSSDFAPVLTSLAQSERLFVKVHMDGLSIGRKLDLRTINNYDELSAALEEMFKGFIKVQSGDKGQQDSFCTSEKKLKFVCNSEYVIAYEDRDGDLMLVGDVPWGMFIVTVKRLRIMKGSGATGLSLGSSDKVKRS